MVQGSKMEKLRLPIVSIELYVFSFVAVKQADCCFYDSSRDMPVLGHNEKLFYLKTLVITIYENYIS